MPRHVFKCRLFLNLQIVIIIRSYLAALYLMPSFVLGFSLTSATSFETMRTIATLDSHWILHIHIWR